MAPHRNHPGDNWHATASPLRRPSPTSSSLAVPDSRSPEPKPRHIPARCHDYAHGESHTAAPALKRSPPTSLGRDSLATLARESSYVDAEDVKPPLVPQRTAALHDPVKAEDDDDDDWSTFRRTASTRPSPFPTRFTRSRSPSAVDPLVRHALKAEQEAEHEAPHGGLSAAERRALWSSRVNDERRRPRRRRERAPSYDLAVKAELDEGLFRVASNADAGEAADGSEEDEEEGPMLPPGGARLPKAALVRRAAPQPPSSSEDRETDDDDGTGPRTGKSSLFLSEEEDEEDDEGTPFEEPPPKRQKVVARCSNNAEKKAKERKKKLTKAELERETSGFLEALDLPAPVFRPVGVKQRLINQLADSTAALPPQARVERVEVPPRSTSLPPEEEEDASSALFGDLDDASSARAPTPPPLSAPEQANPRAASPAGSLPDYDDEDEGPEQVLRTVDDPELLEEQSYFRRPDRAGAIQRWVVMLDRDRRPLPLLYDRDVLAADLTLLASIPLHVPSPTSAPSALFSAGPARALVQGAPSRETCAALWEDLLSPSHPAKHAQAHTGARAGDEPRARGRGCRCPVWVPPTGPGAREWRAERERLEREEGLGVAELVEAARGAFDLDAQAVAGELRGDERRMEALVEILYTHNWLWYAQLVALAHTAHASRLLASPALVRALTAHLSYARGRFRAEHALAQRRHEDDRARAHRQGRVWDKALWQEVGILEGKWREEERNLEDLLERLEARLAEQDRAPPPSLAAHAAETRAARDGRSATLESVSQNGRGR